MRRLVAIALLAILAVGCTQVGEPISEGTRISYSHDDAHHVSCWAFHEGYAGGISCLPDSEVQR